MKKYKCSICSKVIEEDIQHIELCPSCGSPKDFLEPIEEEIKKEIKKIEGPIPVDDNNPSIERITEKCIQCGLCSKICQEKVGIRYNLDKAKEPICVNCGQCIINCPTGALVPKYCYKKVMNYIHDTEKVVVACTSPSVRVALGEEFGMMNQNVEGKMVGSLKQLDFDYVFDTTFGADLTIMEEASELIERVKAKKNLPQFTSCCPAWVKYVEMYHPKLLKYISSCKSPIGMQSALIKTYFSEKMNIPKDNIIAVAITPCTAKKSEITRYHDCDFVITTSELAMMMRENHVDFETVEEKEFDSLMARGSGAGVIFGNSGGVMEAAVRTAYHMITGNTPPEKFLEFQEVRGYQNLKETTISIGDITLNLLVAFGLPHIEPILEELEKGNCKYDFIEVMNCPGGCVGGGGQPLGAISKQSDMIEKRITNLYQEDQELKTRYSYSNSDIIEVYEKFLEHPLSEKAIELLHTTYQDKSSVLGE